MKKFTYCFILLLYSFFSYSQSSQKLDSLKNVLTKLPKERTSFRADTVRVRVLCEMGEIAFFFDVDSSFKMAQKSYLLSKDINWSEGIAMSYNVLATLYSAKNEYMTAIDYLYKSLLISEKDNNELLSAKNYRILGDCYSLLSQYDKAKVFNERSIKLYKKNKDIRNYVLGINNLGLVYHDEKRFEKAISLFKMGLRINESYKFKNLDTYFLSNMGLSYVQLKKYKEALVCYNEVRNQQKKTKTVPIYSQIIILISIAEVLEYQNEPFKSLRYLNDAEKLIKMGEGTDDVQQFYSEISYRVFKNLKKV